MTWVTFDNQLFVSRRAPIVMDTLPPGVYNVYEDMEIEFIKRETSTKELIDLAGSPNEEVLRDIEDFWASRASFEKYSVPYKRGILMYGPPGCGKSSTLAQISDRIVERGGYVIIFSEVGEFKSGVSLLRQKQPDAPIVCVMEDLDNLVDINSVSAILNLLDGAYEDIQNIVYLATTNNPENLQNNIINRPSRFDRRIEFGPPNAKARRAYLQAIIDSGKGKPGPEPDVDIDKLVAESKDLSFAHLKEMFLAIALFKRDLRKVVEELKSIPTSNLETKEEVLDEEF